MNPSREIAHQPKPKTPPFDLRDEPWLPVRASDGVERLVGLRDLLLSAHRLDDLAVPVPPAASGIWRILYALAARVTGLDDPAYTDSRLQDWLKERKRLLRVGSFDPERVAAYLDGEFHGRFDLFGPRPFLQEPRLVDQCSKSSGINKLVFARPSGNNHAWFAHTMDAEPRPLEPAEAAWYLIAQLYYGASGRCTTRSVEGTSSASTKAGPLRGAISFHPRGRNLFESLLAGLPHPASTDDPGEDACPWESNLPDPLAASRRVTWPGGLLTARARHAVLLVPSSDGKFVVDAYLTWGDTKPVEANDPYVIRNVSKKGDLYTRPADSDRAIWRDLDALLLDDGGRSERPDVFHNLDTLPVELRRSLRVRAFGFDQDGQAADKQYFAAVTPELSWALDDDAARRARAYRLAAEDVGRRLGFAARTAWSEATTSRAARLDGGAGPWHERALGAYWPRAEQRFWRLVNEDAPDADPRRPFVDEAVKVIGEVASRAATTLQGAKALSHAIAILRALPNKTNGAQDGRTAK